MAVILTDLDKALQSLKIIMADHQSYIGKGSVALGLRDGAIQRFKYSYELAWKIIRRCLEDSNENIGQTRQDMYRAAWEANLIDSVADWWSFHLARNDTSHSYRAEYAERIFAVIPQFITACDRLLAEAGRYGGTA